MFGLMPFPLTCIQSRAAVLPPEGSGADVSDELQSSVPLSELAVKGEDLEQKVDNLSTENMTLTAKLIASHEMESLQQEKITILEERLVQASKAHVSLHF